MRKNERWLDGFLFGVFFFLTNDLKFLDVGYKKKGEVVFQF